MTRGRVGLTFDTGALIALERRTQRIWHVYRTAMQDAALARAAGEALASIRSASPVDAVVMASAARRGDVVYTSDVGDLERLRRHFPGVRVLAV